VTSSADLTPDAATELRLIRAEITAIRLQVIREQEARERAHVTPATSPPKVQDQQLPGTASGVLLTPERRYRVLKAARTRVHHRAHLGTLSHERISRQRRTTLWLTVFAAARTAVWIVCMALIGVYALGLGGSFIRGFAHLSSLVLWVSLISYYCNASTDAANLMAGIAALFSSDSHAATVAATVSFGADFDAMEADIARLADLQPGEEATELASSIRGRLQAEPGRA